MSVNRSLLGISVSSLLLAAATLAAPAQAMPAPDRTSQVEDCTANYQVYPVGLDKFCASMGWHPQSDGSGVVVEWLRLKPLDCYSAGIHRYENPSANIFHLSVRNSNNVEVWSRSTVTIQSDCGRTWDLTPNLQVNTQCANMVANQVNINTYKAPDPPEVTLTTDFGCHA